MALGVVLHAPLAFITPEIWEAVGVPWYKVPKTEDWVLMLLGWIHQWRMPVFFLLAGFFGLMILRRRGAPAFLGDRVVRLGLTLALLPRRAQGLPAPTPPTTARPMTGADAGWWPASPIAGLAKL